MFEKERVPTIVERYSSQIVWYIGILIMAGGLTLSWFLCVDWLSRSGALIIAILLLAFGLDRRKKADFEELTWEKYSEWLENREFDAQKSGPPSHLIRAYFAELDSAYRFRKSEFQLAAVATLVWGFGDLLVEKIC